MSGSWFELAKDGDELVWRGAVGRVGGEVEECDLTLMVDDDVGAELQGVVTTRHADALACENCAQARARDAGAQHPEWLWPAGAERLVQRSFRIRNDEGIAERDLVTPGGGSIRALWCDDDQAATCFLDFRNGLHDTAKVGAADVSAGVPREVHDSRMPEEVVVGDDFSVGAVELEGREQLHAAILALLRHNLDTDPSNARAMSTAPLACGRRGLRALFPGD